jgi:hypothetical protein
VRLAGFLKLIPLNFILLFVSLHAHASTIVNINSRSNNAATPVNVSLAAGTYQIETIGTSEGGQFNAWNPWYTSIPTTCTEAGGCPRTYPTTIGTKSTTGWLNTYQVTSPYITEVSVNGYLINPVQAEPPVLPFVSFFVVSSQTTYFRVEDGFCYPTALNALSRGQTAVFTLSQIATVGFSFWDLNANDNAGGISLSISAVPIPATVYLLGTGLIGLVGLRRKLYR